MKRIPIWRRFDRILGPDPSADVRDELRFHIEAKIDELIALGHSPVAAREEAARQFGDLKTIQQFGQRIGERMEHRRRLKDYCFECLQDVRYTLRSLSRNRTFAAVAILVLALGIGVNVAVFSVVNTLLLRPLPFPSAQQLVWFTAGKSFDAKIRTAGGLSAETYTVDAYREFQRSNQSFQSLTAYQTFYNSLQYKLTGTGEPKQLDAVEVADNFFPTLGVQPAIGRNFTEEECLKGGRSAVLLSYFFWKTQFASDPAIVGKTVTINNNPVTIVGVLPASFDFGAVFAPGKKVDIFVPAVMDFWKTWGNTLAVVGHLKPGVTVIQAQDEADHLFPQLYKQHKDWYYDYASDVTGLKEHVSGKLRRSLVALWSAVGLILLIVCVNLSNLQLARAAARTKELAMRRALGASRGRLIRQMLTESLVLSLGGAALGLAIAYGIVFSLAHQVSITLPLLSTIHVDSAALAWSLLIALVVGILFGLAPAFKMSGSNLEEALKDSAGTGVSRSHERFRSALVVTEIALACVLLVGAGLLLRSFLHVLEVDLGFEPTHAAAMQIDLPPVANSDPNNAQLIRRAAIFKSAIDRVSALPGVQSVAITDMLPLDRNRSWGLQSVGRPHAKDADSGALVYLVTPGYLSTMGMRLRAGRDFSWHDSPNDQHVLVINEAMARREWPGEDPIGKLAYATGKAPDRVIGVVGDVHESSLEQASSPTMYVPITQNSDVEGATLVVRSHVAPESLASSVLATLKSLNAEQPATEFRSLNFLVDHAVSPRRFFVLLVTVFAALGTLLAALGIYGVISYSVTQKTRDIGVRMALGATTARVQREILFNTLRLAIIGIVLGSVASVAATRLIASLLFATSPSDPVTYVWMVAAILTVALLSGFLPARRASRIEPMTALRNN